MYGPCFCFLVAKLNRKSNFKVLKLMGLILYHLYYEHSDTTISPSVTSQILTYLFVILGMFHKIIIANSADPDQTAL